MNLSDLLAPIDRDYKRRIAELFDAISMERPDPSREGIKTLCEVCGNACGGCEWTEFWTRRPVPGWDAVRRDVKNRHMWNGKVTYHYTESYVVLHCPKFRMEERWTEWFEAFDPEKRRKALKK